MADAGNMFRVMVATNEIDGSRFTDSLGYIIRRYYEIADDKITFCSMLRDYSELVYLGFINYIGEDMIPQVENTTIKTSVTIEETPATQNSINMAVEAALSRNQVEFREAMDQLINEDGDITTEIYHSMHKLICNKQEVQYQIYFQLCNMLFQSGYGKSMDYIYVLWGKDQTALARVAFKNLDHQEEAKKLLMACLTTDMTAFDYLFYDKIILNLETDLKVTLERFMEYTADNKDGDIDRTYSALRKQLMLEKGELTPSIGTLEKWLTWIDKQETEVVKYVKTYCLLELANRAIKESLYTSAKEIFVKYSMEDFFHNYNLNDQNGTSYYHRKSMVVLGEVIEGVIHWLPEEYPLLLDLLGKNNLLSYANLNTSRLDSMSKINNLLSEYQRHMATSTKRFRKYALTLEAQQIVELYMETHFKFCVDIYDVMELLCDKVMSGENTLHLLQLFHDYHMEGRIAYVNNVIKGSSHFSIDSIIPYTKYIFPPKGSEQWLYNKVLKDEPGWWSGNKEESVHMSKHTFVTFELSRYDRVNKELYVDHLLRKFKNSNDEVNNIAYYQKLKDFLHLIQEEGISETINEYLLPFINRNGFYDIKYFPARKMGVSEELAVTILRTVNTCKSYRDVEILIKLLSSKHIRGINENEYENSPNNHFYWMDFTEKQKSEIIQLFHALIKKYNFEEMLNIYMNTALRQCVAIEELAGVFSDISFGRMYFEGEVLEIGKDYLILQPTNVVSGLKMLIHKEIDTERYALGQKQLVIIKEIHLDKIILESEYSREWLKLHGYLYQNGPSRYIKFLRDYVEAKTKKKHYNRKLADRLDKEDWKEISEAYKQFHILIEQTNYNERSMEEYIDILGPNNNPFSFQQGIMAEYLKLEDEEQYTMEELIRLIHAVRPEKSIKIYMESFFKYRYSINQFLELWIKEYPRADLMQCMDEYAFSPSLDEAGRYIGLQGIYLDKYNLVQISSLEEDCKIIISEYKHGVVSLLPVIIHKNNINTVILSGIANKFSPYNSRLAFKITTEVTTDKGVFTYHLGVNLYDELEKSKLSNIGEKAFVKAEGNLQSSIQKDGKIKQNFIAEKVTLLDNCKYIDEFVIQGYITRIYLERMKNGVKLLKISLITYKNNRMSSVEFIQMQATGKDLSGQYMNKGDLVRVQGYLKAGVKKVYNNDIIVDKYFEDAVITNIEKL